MCVTSLLHFSYLAGFCIFLFSLTTSSQIIKLFLKNKKTKYKNVLSFNNQWYLEIFKKKFLMDFPLMLFCHEHNFDCLPMRGVRTTWYIYVFTTIIVNNLSSNISAVYRRLINNPYSSLESPICTKHTLIQSSCAFYIKGLNRFLDFLKDFNRLITRNSETVLKRNA